MKLKPLILIIAVLLLALPLTYSAPYGNFSVNPSIYKNQSDIFKKYNFSASTDRLDLDKNITTMGFVYYCKYDNEGEATFTQTAGTLSVESSSLEGKEMRIDGVGSSTAECNPASTTINLTIEAFVVNYPAGIAHKIAISTAGNAPMIAQGTDPVANYYSYYDSGWVATTIRNSDTTQNNYAWVKVDNANKRIVINNMSSTGYFSKVTTMGTTAYSDKVMIEGNSNGEGEVIDAVRVYDSTLTYNLSANTTEIITQRLPTAQSSYDIYVLSNVSEKELDLQYAISCNNYTNWAYSAETNGGSNKSTVTCSGSQSSNDLAVRIIKVNTSTMWHTVFWDVAAAPPAGTPVITISYPPSGAGLDNSTFPIMINGTVTVSGGTINNTRINDTRFTNRWNNSFFNFTPNEGLADGIYGVMILANNSDGTLANATITFTVDTSPPSPTSSLDRNNTLFYAYTNITFQINFTDNIQIFFFNVSTPEGFLFNLTNLNTPKYIYNGSINVSNYGIGFHTLTAEFCDAHTGKSIPSYLTSKDIAAHKLIYETPEKDIIGIKLKTATKNLSDFGTYKLDDRYVFWYDFGKEDGKAHNYTFKIDNLYQLDYIKSNYRGHFATKFNWIDFEFAGNEDAIYDIKQTADEKYEVKITTTKTNLTFNSIGNLNCRAATWNYYVFNYSASYSSNVVETVTDTIKLVITFQNLTLNGSGTLNYDGVDYNTTNISSSNQANLTYSLTIPQVSGNETNVTFFWNFKLNTTQSFTTINFTQLVQRITLSTCGALTNIPTLNITIYNEENPSEQLVTSVDAVFTVWTNNSGNTVNFTFDFDGHSNYTVCIFPNTTVSADAYMFYNSSGGFRERWILDDVRLNYQNTSLLSLFNFKTTAGIDELRGTLRDINFKLYSGVITQLQRFYPNENAWRAIQMDRSSEKGDVLFHVTEGIIDYRLYFYRDGAIIENTDTLKFLCDATNICEVTFLIDESRAKTNPELLFAYGYSNASEVFQLNFSDATGLTSVVRLIVTKETGAASTIICDTSVSASSGTINCDTSGYSGTLKAQILKQQSHEVVTWVIWINKALSQIYKLANIGFQETGLWAAGISITLITAGAVASPVIAIIAFIFSLVVIFWLGLLNFMTMGLIIVFAVLAILISIILKRT
ncbi:MAG: hypothetical protein A2W74_00425 [Planctomycetes bacterium RIFCSPLOWO2_12_38_17]|nr:MAG: hypothetical protein A2W74_00425 [Planctomycetes bacterium RIFCSPLOWO2_12_38_17]